MRFIAAIALVICGSLPAARADDEVRAAAVERFERARYAEAAARFSFLYLSEESADALFAWGQAERLGGDCDRAISLYSLYLSFQPPRANREAAVAAIGACDGTVQLELTRPGAARQEEGISAVSALLKSGYAASGDAWFLLALLRLQKNACGVEWKLLNAALEEGTDPLLRSRATPYMVRCSEAAAAPAKPPPEQKEPGGPKEPDRSKGTRTVQPWYRDGWGLGLTATGAAVMAVGAGLWWDGDRRVRDSTTGDTYGQFRADLATAERRRWTGIGVAAAGAATLGLGIWRLLAAEEAEEWRATLRLDAAGGSVALVGPLP